MHASRLESARATPGRTARDRWVGSKARASAREPKAGQWWLDGARPEGLGSGTGWNRTALKADSTCAATRAGHELVDPASRTGRARVEGRAGRRWNDVDRAGSTASAGNHERQPVAPCARTSRRARLDGTSLGRPACAQNGNGSGGSRRSAAHGEPGSTARASGALRARRTENGSGGSRRSAAIRRRSSRRFRGISPGNPS